MTRMDAMARFLALLMASVGLASIGSVRAVSEPAPRLLTQGGPDDYGYRFIDNINEPTGPSYAALWQDISGSGTPLAIVGDELSVTFMNPILIRYYGQNWGTAPSGSGLTVVSPDVGVSSNCLLRLLGAGQAMIAGPYVNTALPSNDSANAPGGFISPYWNDMGGDPAVSSTSTAQWQVMGTAPDRRLIVQWTNWGYWNGPTFDMTLQVQITESDGVVDSEVYFIYQSVTATDVQQTGATATIGIQPPGGVLAFQYSFDTAGTSTPDGSTTPPTPRVIRFYTPSQVVNLPDPTGLAQFLADGTTPLATGGSTGPTLVLSAATANPNGNARAIQVEVQPTTQPLTGSSTHTGAAFTGGVVSVSIAGINSGNYHWRARVLEPAAGFISNWVAYGGNDNAGDPTDPNGATDFTMVLGVGGPDGFGYTFADDRALNGPVFATEFEDLSTIGSAITTTDWLTYSSYPGDNEGHVELPIGFTFSFYGIAYTTTWVNTNYFLRFGGPTVATGTGGQEAWQTTTLPSLPQSNIIAAKWQDSDGMTARYATLGTAPNRRFVVSWTGGGQTVEAKLYENGQIVLLYPTLLNPNDSTVGIQDSAGTTGLLYNRNGGPEPLVNNRAIRFAPPAPAPVPSGGSGSSGRCGSVGLDLMVPLGLLFVWRKLRRKERR